MTTAELTSFANVLGVSVGNLKILKKIENRKKLVSVAEYAAQIGVKPRTLEMRLRRRGIKPVDTRGHTNLFSPSDLVAVDFASR